MKTMVREATTVSLKEFSSNLEELFDRVTHKSEEVIIEGEGGERAVLKPASVKQRRGRKREVSEADHTAFLASAGSWSDVDVDKFIESIYESRRMSSRPPVEL